MWCDQTFLWIIFHQKIWILVRFTGNTSKCCLWNCSKIGMSISSSSDELWVKSEPKYPVLSVQRYFLKLLLAFSWYMINESSHPSATTANMDEKQCQGWALVCMFMQTCSKSLLSKLSRQALRNKKLPWLWYKQV